MCDALPRTAIAIPACNEEDGIGRCLEAIATAAEAQHVGVLCLVNGTHDDTFGRACTVAQRLSLPLRILDVDMAAPARNAGGARRLAMDCAADWVEEGGHRGLVLTTDADSAPTRGWVAAIEAHCANHTVDAVAGTIELYPEDAARLPDYIHARGALESEYEALLTEMFARLDPRPHDPWPCHATNSGANLAVTLHAYRAIGGLPMLSCGEDKALVARLDRDGFRVRHARDVRVMTSGRLEGRAAGGVADTIRHRCERPQAACDDYLEPALTARFRAFWRGRLRGIFSHRGAYAALAAYGDRQVTTIPETRTFGQFWDVLEASSDRLARRLLNPSDLPREIDAARHILKRLRTPIGVRTSRADSPLFVPAE